MSKVCFPMSVTFKTLLFLLLFTVIFSGLKAQQITPEKDNLQCLYGFKKDGKWVIEPKYEHCEPCHRASNNKIYFVSKNGKKGLVNIHTGKEIIAPQYASLRTMNSCTIFRFSNSESLYGLVNLENEILLAPKYTTFEPTPIPNIIRFSTDEIHFGLTNLENEILLESKYTYLNCISRHLVSCATSKGGKKSIIDLNTSKTLGSGFGYVSLKRGYIHFSYTTGRHRMYGVMDLAGNVLFEPGFDEPVEFSGSIGIAKKEGRYGVIDKKGNVLQPHNYHTHYGHFEHHILLRRANGRMLGDSKTHYRIIDNKGQFLFEETFSDIARIMNSSQNTIVRTTDGKSGLIGRSSYILKPEYDEISTFRAAGKHPYHKEYSIVRKGTKYGVINANGSFVLPLKYNWINWHEETGNIIAVKSSVFQAFQLPENINVPLDSVYQFYENHAVAYLQRKFGIINLKGEVVVPMKYYKIHPLECATTQFYEPAKGWGLMNYKGEVIVPAGTFGSIRNWFGPKDNPEKRFAVVNSARKSGQKSNGKYGIIDQLGNLVVDTAYTNIFTRYYSYEIEGEQYEAFWVANEEKDLWGLMTTNGSYLLSPVYNYPTPYNPFGRNIIFNNKKLGVIEPDGTIALPFEYDQLLPSVEDIYLVNRNNRWGFEDVKNHDKKDTILPYSNITKKTNGYYFAEKDSSTYGIVDSTGKEVTSFYTNPALSANESFTDYFQFSTPDYSILLDVLKYETNLTNTGLLVSIDCTTVKYIQTPEQLQLGNLINNVLTGENLKGLFLMNNHFAANYHLFKNRMPNSSRFIHSPGFSIVNQFVGVLDGVYLAPRITQNQNDSRKEILPTRKTPVSATFIQYHENPWQHGVVDFKNYLIFKDSLQEVTLNDILKPGYEAIVSLLCYHEIAKLQDFQMICYNPEQLVVNDFSRFEITEKGLLFHFTDERTQDKYFDTPANFDEEVIHLYPKFKWMLNYPNHKRADVLIPYKEIAHLIRKNSILQLLLD
jgi:hypothetical protein